MSVSDRQTEVDPPKNQYLFTDHNVNGSEWERLDELHRGFSAYRNGELTFAPLDKPSRILDIGAGSGAWVLEVANRYPEAKVIAADIAPLPARPLPPNVKYHHCDVLAPLPFEDKSFDVVHIRLVLYHLPKDQHESVLQRVSRILKPQGWLIVEDFGRHKGHSVSPIQAKVAEKFLNTLQRKHLDPDIGAHLGRLLQDTDSFSEINTKKVELTLTADKEFSGVSSGERALSDAVRSTVIKVVENLMNLSEDIRSAGFSSDLQKPWLEERKDPALKIFADVWFAWCRKRQSR